MTARQRRRVALVLASLVAATALAFTLIHPVAAHTPKATTNKSSTELPTRWPPTYFGAIAVAHDGSMGKAWRHINKAAAKQRAMELCGIETCRVVTVFTDCGAVAHNGDTYHGGHGTTRQAAERHAVANIGGGWVIDSLCH